MAYKRDLGLEFLRNVSDEDLNDLVDILKGKDDDKRLTENLTLNDDFKKFYPQHHKYIEVIMEEIQRYGGNTFVNIFRGGGVYYDEILKDANSLPSSK